MQVPNSLLTDNWKHLGEAAQSVLLDARWRGYWDTQAAPDRLKKRLFAAATRTVLNAAKVHLCRVRFGRHRFDFDPDGTWALVAPVTSDHAGEHIIDLGAFDLDDETRRKMFVGKGFAVGLEQAMFDARVHPQERITVHADVWAWLRAECSGLLPVDWERTALWLKEWRVAGVIVENDDQGRKVDQRLRLALKPPPLYVKREACAA